VQVAEQDILDIRFALHEAVISFLGPGDHIPYVAKLFPSCLFVLYDPVPFKFTIKEFGLENVKIFNCFFDENELENFQRQYANTKQLREHERYVLHYDG
jgi:hypothetical protein